MSLTIFLMLVSSSDNSQRRWEEIKFIFNEKQEF